MKFSLLLALSLGFMSLNASAASLIEPRAIDISDGGLLFDTPSTMSDPKACPGDALDPFEQNLRFISARGQACVADDVMHYRSIRILSDEQKKDYGIDTKSLAIANFTHDGKFFIAQVDPDQVQSVYFLTEYFPVSIAGQALNGLAGHTMIRFELKPGSTAHLIEQDRVPNRAHAEVRNIILSIEALEPVNDLSYTIFAGLKESYAVVYRLISGAERFSEISNTTDPSGPHRVRQRLLTLSGAEGAKLLQQAIDWSNLYQEKYFYETVMRSCSTEAYRLIDSVIPTAGNQMAIDLANLGLATIDPVLSDGALSARKILSSTPVPDFNDDPEARE